VIADRSACGSQCEFAVAHFRKRTWRRCLIAYISYDFGMDPFRDSDIRIVQETPPASRLLQALEMMEEGLRWKRAQLARDQPDASQHELDRMLLAWLVQND